MREGGGGGGVKEWEGGKMREVGRAEVGARRGQEAGVCVLAYFLLLFFLILFSSLINAKIES